MPIVKDYLSDFERLGIHVPEAYHLLHLGQQYADLLKHLKLIEKGRARNTTTGEEYIVGGSHMKIGDCYVPPITRSS